MNNLRIIRTRLDNWARRARGHGTDLNGPGCLHRNLRILAGWQTAFATIGLALAIGSILPKLTNRSKGRFIGLDLRYAALSIWFVLLGAYRQRLQFSEGEALGGPGLGNPDWGTHQIAAAADAAGVRGQVLGCLAVTRAVRRAAWLAGCVPCRRLAP